VPLGVLLERLALLLAARELGEISKLPADRVAPLRVRVERERGLNWAMAVRVGPPWVRVVDL